MAWVELDTEDGAGGIEEAGLDGRLDFEGIGVVGEVGVVNRE